MATSHELQDGQIKISKRVEKELHHTKVVVRRLPPDITEEKLLEILSDIPAYSYFYVAAGDPSLGDFATSRAYFSFIDEASIIPFRDKYDGLPLESVKGQKYRAVIEFAPCQGIPKRLKKKPDSRLATIEQDADYQGFLETFNVKREPPSMAELSAYVDSLAASKIPVVQRTPLIEYLTENHRRGGRTSKRSKAAGDLKKKRSKESTRAVKESHFKGEDGAKSGSKEWGAGKSKKDVKEKGGKRTDSNGPTGFSRSTGSSSSLGDGKWLGSSSSDRSKEKGKGWREGGRAWKGGGGTERDGEGRREGGKGGRRGGRGGRKEGSEEGWVREDGGRRAEGGEGGWRGGSGYREKRGSRPSGDGEGKVKESSTRNKDRPDQAIYSPRGRPRMEYNHTTGSEGSTEVKKGSREREDGSHAQSSRSEGWKKREQVNGEKSQSRGHDGWDEYGGGGGGKGRRHESGGGSRRGRNRDVYTESASRYHDK